MYAKMISAAVIVLTLAAACKAVIEPRGQRVIGILEWRSGAQGSLAPAASRAGDAPPAVITAPDTVNAGVPFTATITTTGPDL